MGDDVRRRMAGQRHWRGLRYAALCLVTLGWATERVAAEEWRHWRGPHFNGSTTAGSLPEEFGPDANVAWSVELAGAAAATPIVVGDLVLVSGVDANANTLTATAYDRRDGSVRWSHVVAEGVRQDNRSNYASPSPAADGEHCVFFYGNGDLVAFDMRGERLWKRNIQDDYGHFAFLWTFSSSPTLWNDKLYLQILQRDVPVEGRGFADKPNESYLLALDPSTGETLWRQVRPSRARAESREAFSTPIPYVHDQKKQLLIAGGDALTCHDAETGTEIWRWGTWNPERIPHWRLVPSPVVGNGVVLACAPKRDPIYAIRSGGSGTLSDAAVAWVSRELREVSSDVPTPAFYDGDFFVLSDVRKSLSRVDAETGDVKWSVELPGRAKYEASPLVGDGKVYTINFDGEVGVFATEDGTTVMQASMDKPQDGEMVRASISAADGQLFIRTTRTLYCVGESR